MERSLNAFDLTGRTALITGAAGLLGIEHSSALLESGATVILTDLSDDKLKTARAYLARTFDSRTIFTQVMDVSQSASIQEVAEDLATTGLLVDVLVNNAAIDPKVDTTSSLLETSRLENFTLHQWNLQIAVGLTGAFLCCQVFGPQMASRGKGVILNIASDLSVISPDQRLYRKADLVDELQPVKPVTYSVIKAGLVGLTRYLATYWADKGIRCNALSPGGVYNEQPHEFVQRLTSLIPLARMANRDEYRGAVQFLCSDASAYLNGHNLVMDGGRTIW